MIRQTCRQVAAWSALRPEGERLTAAVNLSARQFASTDFLDDVGRAVSDFGLPPASLAVEVNERVVARDMSRAVGVLTNLADVRGSTDAKANHQRQIGVPAHAIENADGVPDVVSGRRHRSCPRSA